MPPPGSRGTPARNGDVPRTAEPAGKWNMIALLAAAEFLGMSVWFSAAAVVPFLTTHWQLSGGDVAWLTMAVQIGFVVGTLCSSLLNLADYFAGHRFFAVSSFLAALTTVLIPAFDFGFSAVLGLRFLTGMALAGVYPVGMKIMATWTKEDRGLGIGLLVGALTVGAASPHLANALGGVREWRMVFYSSSCAAFAGGWIALLFIREGPYRTAFPRFNWNYAANIFRQRDLALANFGYLGHMWELYAMWAWIPLFLLASFEVRGVDSSWSSLAAFAVIAAGGVGSTAAGYLADRFGRTTITIISMAASGFCALVVGLLFGGNPVVLVLVCVIWGFAVVADSAQFSACVTELCEPEYLGTVLTLQTSIGFLLTMVTIRLVPPLVQWVTWKWAFAFLALGPALGIWAMDRLRLLPSSIRIAGGRR